jgi:hypothetical protein
MKILNVTAVDRLSGEGHIITVGRNGVISIEEHRPAGEGDKWFYDIICSDGRKVRLFDFSSVEIEQD